jgi:16S rRNA (cytosine967-C5)-methyltransferase
MPRGDVFPMPQSTGIQSRRAALKILSQVREGRPFEAALDRVAHDLAEPDRRLAHELAAGVLRQRTLLDRQLAPLIPRGWSSVAGEMQDILRLGVYQLTALERVPAHAAVDTSVTLAKQAGGKRGAAFVNAVLRRLTRSGPHPDVPAGGIAPGLAARYSHPLWLVERWVETFGPPQTEALLQWNNTRPRLVVQPARKGLEVLEARWRAAGIKLEAAPYGAGLIPSETRPAELPGYLEGDFIVQDPAQALLVRFAAPPAGACIYDACAAPGGKTIALGCATRVVAGEINPRRARRLADNLARAGSGREHVVVADARQPPLKPMEVVLLDAPCLGTGTFARHPDARWRVAPEALARIVKLQAQLLDRTARVVAPGGLLLYSTCSLEPEENHLQVDGFLSHHPEFHREEMTGVPNSLLSPQGDLVILPQLHGMDGAYAARLRRSV